jgi:hypothetical protein
LANQDRTDMIAIASGDLIDHVIHPSNPRKKICVYSLKTPVSAASIMLAIGPFECLDLPGWGTSSQPGTQGTTFSGNDASVPDSDHHLNAGSGSGTGRNSEGRFYGGGRTFVLPGRRAQAEHTIAFLNQVFYFFLLILQSSPCAGFAKQDYEFILESPTHLDSPRPLNFWSSTWARFHSLRTNKSLSRMHTVPVKRVQL